jgi:hypothetical protein
MASLNKYLVKVQGFGDVEIESNDIFFALESLIVQLKKVSVKYKILNVWIIKENNEWLEITCLLNPYI